VRMRIAQIGLDRARNGTDRGYGLNTDGPKVRTVRGSGLDVVMNRSRSRSVRGLAAASDRTRTVQGFRLCAVVGWTRSRKSCGHGQFTDVCADRSRTGIVRGHGQTAIVVADRMRTWTERGRGSGLDKSTASRPHNGADISHLTRLRGFERLKFVNDCKSRQAFKKSALQMHWRLVLVA
jgi:hypothetical protein